MTLQDAPPTGSAGIKDWATFYTGLQSQGNVPDASRAVITSTKAIFRGLCLDLSNIKESIRQSGVTPILTTIYADVLLVPEYTDWLLSGSGLVVFARRIEVTGSATVNLDYRDSSSAQLLVFAAEMVGTWSVIAVEKEQKDPVLFSITEANVCPGISINAQDGKPTSIPVNLQQGIAFQLPEDMLLYLNNAFIYGSLLYDQKPDLALSIFLWVKDWAAESDQFDELFYRSASLVTLLSAQINAAANGAAFVPYLTSTVYTTLAQAFANYAAAYERDYKALSTQKVLTDEGIALARTLAANAESEVSYVQALLKQANDNYDNAVAAVRAAELNFTRQQKVVDLVAIDFQKIGLPTYEAEQIAASIFTLVSAIATFAFNIALMAVGDEAAAPAAAQGAAKAVEVVEDVAKNGAEVVKQASTLAATMKKLKKLVEELKKVYEFAKAIKDAASNIQSALGKVKVIQKMQKITDGADLSAADGWAVYKIQADSVLQSPVEKGIGFAADYRDALDILVVYGQSLSAAQLAVIKASQESAAITFQLYYAEKKQENFQKLVEQLKAGEAPMVSMMQEFYRKYLDAKGLLFSALKSYQASYFYWALHRSTVQPKIVDPVANLDSGIKDITHLAMDSASAVERFDPPPQQMKNMIFVCTDPKVLQQLQSEGSCHWVVPLDSSEFAGLERVRLSTVRVWLEGAVTKQDSDSVHIIISSAGNYLDRYSNTDYQFVSKPLQRVFEYRIAAKAGPDAWHFENKSRGIVEIDGAVDREVAYAYFQPTPFAEWSISLPKALNAAVDYSKVTKITMYFEGTAIGSTSAASAMLLAKRSPKLEEALA